MCGRNGFRQAISGSMPLHVPPGQAAGPARASDSREIVTHAGLPGCRNPAARTHPAGEEVIFQPDLGVRAVAWAFTRAASMLYAWGVNSRSGGLVSSATGPDIITTGITTCLQPTCLHLPPLPLPSVIRNAHRLLKVWCGGWALLRRIGYIHCCGG